MAILNTFLQSVAMGAAVVCVAVATSVPHFGAVDIIELKRWKKDQL